VVEEISDLLETSSYSTLDQLEIHGDYLNEAVKAPTFSSSYIRDMAEFLRDRFYLPLNMNPDCSYLINSGAYAKQFVEMLKGNNPHLDPTFTNLPEMIDHFTIRDIPVKIHLETGSCTFVTRVIESKETIEGKKLRLILFSFYGHQTEDGSPWNPLTTHELSSAPLEVLRAFGQELHIHSMMTFSLGNFLLDSLKHVSAHDGEMIPKTLIINRGLASIWKVATQLFSYPVSYLLYQAAYHLGLDANPEKEILDFFDRMQTQTPKSMEGRKVVVLEATLDHYFSGNGALDPEFRDHLENLGVEAYRGSFLVPLIEEHSHHAVRLDFLINNKDSGTTSTHFLPIKHNESLPSSLVSNLMSEVDESGYHNLFIAGGNKDNLNSITYLQAALLMSAFVHQYARPLEETPYETH
jgi:hypothetical protein